MAIHLLKDTLNYIPRLIGYELRKTRNESQILNNLKLKTVLDIGSNNGQFATSIRMAYPHAEIHCFEPLPEAAANIQRIFSDDGKLTVHRTAVGERNGEVTFYQNDFSPSSSILELGDLVKKNYPHVQKTHEIKVPITTLDAWAETQLLATPILLKLDVQGYEFQALQGSLKLLQQVSWVWTEVSFCELYQGQALFNKITRKLEEHGFLCQGIFNCEYNRNGQCLFSDAFYSRS